MVFVVIFAVRPTFSVEPATSKFEGWNCTVSSELSVIGGPVPCEMETPGVGGWVCSTKPGSLLELTPILTFETGSSWKLVKSEMEAESSNDRSGEPMAVERDSSIRK